jgi:hypothetical protein
VLELRLQGVPALHWIADFGLDHSAYKQSLRLGYLPHNIDTFSNSTPSI